MGCHQARFIFLSPCFELVIFHLLLNFISNRRTVISTYSKQRRTIVVHLSKQRAYASLAGFVLAWKAVTKN
jgi:hypothetical protein